jgi:hypothetical protein
MPTTLTISPVSKSPATVAIIILKNSFMVFSVYYIQNKGNAFFYQSKKMPLKSFFAESKRAASVCRSSPLIYG